MITFFEQMTYSEDEELICRTTPQSLNIYDTNNFNLLFKLDPFRIGLSGDITKVKLFFNTKIIAFSIIESQKVKSKEEGLLYNNSTIKSHSLILYNIEDYEIIGKIKIKNYVEIDDFLITKYFIIIMIENKNKCILFKTSNLEYFKTIKSVESGKIIYSDDYYIQKYKSKKSQKGEKDKEEKKEEEVRKSEKCILAHQDLFDKNLIHLIKFFFNDDGTKVLQMKKRDLQTNLNSQETKYFAFVSSYLIISSYFGNKVHLYDIETGKFKYCLNLGNFPYEMSGIHLDNKEKILCIITNNKYLKLYKLKKLNTECKCASNGDEKIQLKEKSGMLHKFKHKLGVGRNDILCRYKINNNDFDLKDNKTLVFFDKNENDIIFIVQSNKIIKKIQFDRKKNKEAIILTEAILPKYTVNKKDLRTLSLIMEEEKKEKEEENKHRNKEGNNRYYIIEDDDDFEEIIIKREKKNIVEDDDDFEEIIIKRDEKKEDKKEDKQEDEKEDEKEDKKEDKKDEGKEQPNNVEDDDDFEVIIIKRDEKKDIVQNNKKDNKKADKRKKK